MFLFSSVIIFILFLIDLLTECSSPKCLMIHPNVHHPYLRFSLRENISQRLRVAETIGSYLRNVQAAPTVLFIYLDRWPPTSKYFRATPSGLGPMASPRNNSKRHDGPFLPAKMFGQNSADETLRCAMGNRKRGKFRRTTQVFHLVLVRAHLFPPKRLFMGNLHIWVPLSVTWERMGGMGHPEKKQSCSSCFGPG